MYAYFRYGILNSQDYTPPRFKKYYFIQKCQEQWIPTPSIHKDKVQQPLQYNLHIHKVTFDINSYPHS